MEEVFMATVTFEEFALRFGQHHLIQSVPVISVSGEKVGKSTSFNVVLLIYSIAEKDGCSQYRS